MDDATKKSIQDILGSAEADIRTLLSETALTGSVSDISRLAEIAKQLNRMGEKPEGEMRYDTDDDYPCIREASSGPDTGKPPYQSSTASSQSRSKHRKKDEYPKFHWENNGQILIKTGWSRKKKKEYRHKVSKRILELLQQKLEKLGKDGNRFTMDDILPLKDDQSDTEISSYKVYLCLGYLESQGKIERAPEGITLKQ